MPLNLSVNDGDITPYLKYNAKAGRFYVRTPGGSEDIEVDKPRLAIDMARIKTGWIFFQEGVGPEKVWDPSPTQMAPRPTGPKKWKRGFEVMAFGNDNLPGVGKLGLREFASTAGTVITSLHSMYAEYERGMAANPNAVPFYRCLGVKPIAGSYGTNYEPLFALIGWVARDKVPAFNAAPNDEDIGWDNAPPPLVDDPFAPSTGPLRVAQNAKPATGGGAMAEAFNDDVPFSPEWR